MLLMALTTYSFMVKSYLKTTPGVTYTRDIKISDRKTDSIELSWNKARNADSYELQYRKKTKEIKQPEQKHNKDTNKTTYHKDEVAGSDNEWHTEEVSKQSAVIRELKEGTDYEVRIIGIKEERKSIKAPKIKTSTKKKPEINVPVHITKPLSTKSFNLGEVKGGNATYQSEDPSIAEVDAKTGEVSVKGKGKVKIKIKTAESKNYVEGKKEIELLLLDTSSSSSIKTIYTLDESNCTKLMSVTGVSGVATIPQSLAYTGDKFIIAYGMHGAQRIVSYDINSGEKSVSVPKVALGHPNGFTYSPDTKLCYCVKGWSGRAVTYSPDTGQYDVMNFRNGLSGIAYDRMNKKFYGSSRTGTSVYDKDYNLEKVFPNVNHSGSVQTQDCGGHGGIFIRCLSGANTHGLNYVDLYDVDSGNYIGTLNCYLSEVESAVVDDDGMLLLLANNTSNTDYIWKTPINIETLTKQ